MYRIKSSASPIHRITATLKSPYFLVCFQELFCPAYCWVELTSTICQTRSLRSKRWLKSTDYCEWHESPYVATWRRMLRGELARKLFEKVFKNAHEYLTLIPTSFFTSKVCTHHYSTENSRLYHLVVSVIIPAFEMRFSTVFAALVSVGVASAQTTHTIIVGGNSSLTFNPTK